VPMLLLGGIPWSITVPASMLALSMYFRRPLSDDAKHTDARSSMSGAGHTDEVSAERANAA
jgi:hypothetical protein